MKLTAKNIKNAKFQHPKGYYMLSGFGIVNEAGQWLTFDGKSPYNPIGGRATASEVANTLTGEPQFIDELA